MPRDASGNYTLPAGNPVISGDVIASTWANATMPDIGDALTNSLSRNGNGGMLVPLTFLDGTGGAPAIAFTNEPSLGTYRIGTGLMGFAAGGAAQLRVSTANQAEVFRDGVWKRVVDETEVAAAIADRKPVGSLEFGYDPNGILTGTWIQLPEGTFLMNTVAGADTSGGSNDAVAIAHQHAATGDHTHDRGTMEITGDTNGIGGDRGVFGSATGAFSLKATETGFVEAGGGQAGPESGFSFLASRTWAGLTGLFGSHQHDSAGVTGTDLNKPLYVGVEVWQRTA